jgi:PPOX class probable F420-dependent enzyme
MTNQTSALTPFVRRRTVLLTSYRRDGRPVGTPVHVAVEGDRAFARTWDATWKVKRIRNNPQVELAPSTFRGKPVGPGIHACARLLTGAEARHAAQALARKYRILHGFLIPLVHRLRGYTTVHLELTPVIDHRSNCSGGSQMGRQYVG